MASALNCRIQNYWPTDAAPVGQAATGGSWGAGTFSFLVVAWWVGTSESDIDYAGWVKTIPTDWKALTIASGSTNVVTIDWVAPLDGSGETRLPDHYKVYWQSGSTFDLAAPGTAAIVEASPSTVTSIPGSSTGPITLYAPGTAQKTFATEGTFWTINPVLDINPEIRQNTTLGFDGRLLLKSYAHVNPLRSIEIQIVPSSITQANYKLLLKAALYSLNCRIEDPDTTSYINFFFGRFSDVSHIGQVGKTNRGAYTIKFNVETATLY